MPRALPFALGYLVPASLILGLQLGGLWSFSTVILVFGLTPVLDALLGLEQTNPDEDRLRSGRPLRYDLWLWLWVPTQLALIAWTLKTVVFDARSMLEIVGLTLSLGVMAGAGGITYAHELMHRSSAFDRLLAEVLMTSVTYPHFSIEHVHGHHRHVATPHDPATSRRGETVYRFLPRTLFGSLKSAWSIETRRVRERGVRRFTLADRRFRYLLVLGLIYAALAATTGWGGVLFFAAQSAVAFLLLEVINYVEHYGLARKEISAGRYERVLPKHSWNSSHRLTSWYLINLPRHADHHHIASRPYYALRHIEDSPQLPAGYATMVLIALVPPLWRRVMDPRVDRWNAASLHS